MKNAPAAYAAGVFFLLIVFGKNPNDRAFLSAMERNVKNDGKTNDFDIDRIVMYMLFGMRKQIQ